MPTEIERKFLVADAAWRNAARVPGRLLRQGYIGAAAAGGPVVRVRIAGEAGYLTIKGPGLLSRDEFEYPIPLADAAAMLGRLCAPPVITKTRFRVDHAGLAWEVDVFDGHLAGLVLAEVELTAPDQEFARPAWAGAEVTDDPRYQNAALARAAGPPADR